MGYLTDVEKYTDPEKMAADFLAAFFGNQIIEYPINPFAFLKAEGILFKLTGFSKLEGVYIPASDEDDSPVVGINANRPITRQRLLPFMSYVITSEMLTNRFHVLLTARKTALNSLLKVLPLLFLCLSRK